MGGKRRKTDKMTWKSGYIMQVNELLAEYDKVLIVQADNVGSSQMQQIRHAMRGIGVILMGKNTLIKKAITGYMQHNPNLEKLLPHIKTNVGLVFTHQELDVVRNTLLSNKKAAPAKAGAIAPIDVTIPKGNTGMGPEKTSFFQALLIPTKITRAQIEMLTDIHLIKKNYKVGASEATLLNMMNISPFTYGLKVITVYDKGSIYDASLLDITDADVLKHVEEGITNVNALALGIGYPTCGSVVHSLLYGFRNLLSVALATDISFKQADDIKKLLSDPEALAKLQKLKDTKPSEPEAPAQVEENPVDDKNEDASSSDDDMGFGGLFD